jgi:hypothetical protein
MGQFERAKPSMEHDQKKVSYTKSKIDSVEQVVYLFINTILISCDLYANMY